MAVFSYSFCLISMTHEHPMWSPAHIAVIWSWLGVSIPAQGTIKAPDFFFKINPPFILSLRIFRICFAIELLKPPIHMAQISEDGEDLESMSYLKKISLLPFTKNSLWVGVSFLSQVTTVNNSPEMLFKLVDPTGMTR